jgi:hypothetical protein
MSFIPPAAETGWNDAASGRDRFGASKALDTTGSKQSDEVCSQPIHGRAV